MDTIDNQIFGIPERDAAGTQSEPENPTQLQTFSSQILILLQNAVRFLSRLSVRIAQDASIWTTQLWMYQVNLRG